MKKLLFGLIATVMFSVVGNAQKSFDEIGISHNVYAQFILENYTSDVNKENVSEITNKILETNYNFDTKNLQIFSSFGDSNIMLNDLLKQKLISNDLFELCSNNLSKVISSNNYKEVWSFVEIARFQKNNLSVEDKVKYLEFLSVMKYSSYFWDPTGLNGIKFLNKGNQFILNQQSSKVNMWKVFACDCIGGIVAGGPIGYAGASCISMIMQN